MSLNAPNPPSEPLVTVGLVTGFASAVLTLLVAFAVPLTEAQTQAILGVVAIVAPVVVALVGRGKVYAPSTVRSLLSGRR